MRSFEAKGQAAGSAGTVAPGTIAGVILPRAPDKVLSTVRLSLRDGSNSVNGFAPLGGGAVLVELLVTRGELPAASTWGDNPARWRRSCYVPTGDSPTFHPNLPLEEDMRLVARVFCRDDIRSAQVVVDIEYEVGEKDAGPEHCPYPAGSYPRGSGVLRVVVGADPAAGNEPSIAGVVGLRWEVLLLQTQLVTDATVTSRITQYQIANYRGTTSDPRIAGSTGAQGASQTKLLAAGAGMGLADISAGDKFYPLMLYVIVLNGDTLITTTANLQAGDNYTALVAVVEEWVLPEVSAS